MLTIRPLTESDLPAALHLSTQAGWNQLAPDWLRLIRLFPGRCLAGCVDGQVVASATLSTYGDRLGWVGMVLVDQAHRSHGYGTAMLDAVIALGQQQGIATLGLDATDLGQPLYLKRGFVSAMPINRWKGEFVRGRSRLAHERTPEDRRTLALEKLHRTEAGLAQRPIRMQDKLRRAIAKTEELLRDDANRATPRTDGCMAPIPSDWLDVFALDQSSTGLDRSGLLRTIANESGVLTRIFRQSGQLAGFVLARPGRTASHIGPLVAASPDAATALIDSLLLPLSLTDQPLSILIDIPSPSPLEDIVSRRGFTISRRLTRMYRPRVPSLPSPAILAASGFELG